MTSSDATDALYRTLFRAAADERVLFALDSGAVLDASGPACRQLGYTRDELLAMRYEDLLAPGSVTLAEHLERLSTEATVTFAASYISRSGARRAVTIEAHRLRQEGLDVVLAVGTPAGTPADPSGGISAAGRDKEGFYASFEHAAVGLAHLALDGSWLRLNRGFCDIVGFPRDALLGQTIFDLGQEEDRADTALHLRELQAGTAQTHTAEKRFVRPDGSSIWVTQTLSLVRDAGTGEPAYVVAVFVDISARREALAALEEHKRSYRLLADYASDMISRHTPEGTYLDVTPGCRSVLGYEPEELIGRMAYDFFFPDDLEAISDAHAETLQDANSVTALEYRIRIKDGSYCWVESRSQFIREPGWPEEIVAVTRDISEAKAREEALKQARDEATLANQAKSRFLANMSHELRTPLNAIIGYSEMLEEEAEDTGNTDSLTEVKAIHRSGQQLLSLVDDVLALTQLESGRLELDLSTFEVSSLVDEVADAVRENMNRQGNRLSVSVAPDVGAMHADRARVQQCLSKLLSNAAKFTEQGRVSLSVERDTEPSGDVLVFEVSDSGVGMSPDQIEVIFEPFERKGRSPSSRLVSGTGLGLAILRHFCALMDGTITVESAPGEGAAFTLRLPVRVPPGPAEPAPGARSVARPTR